MKKVYDKHTSVFLAVLLLLIFLHYLGLTRPVETAIFRTIASLESRAYTGAKEFVRIFKFPLGKGSDESEYQLLNEEANRLIAENARLKILEEENSVLKQILDLKKNIHLESVSAEIIGADSETNTLIVNKGKDVNLKTGLPVISEKGFLIGKILEVREKFSVILLLADARSRVAAAIYSDEGSKNDKQIQSNGSMFSEKKINRTIGVVEGERGLGIKMNFIPQDIEVGVGDIAATSGLETLVPKGLIIGRVERVISAPHDPFKTAYLQSSLNLDNLSFVLIIIPTGELFNQTR